MSVLQIRGLTIQVLGIIGRVSRTTFKLNFLKTNLTSIYLDFSFVIVYIFYLEEDNGSGFLSMCKTNKHADRMQSYWVVQII